MMNISVIFPYSAIMLCIDNNEHFDIVWADFLRHISKRKMYIHKVF